MRFKVLVRKTIMLEGVAYVDADSSADAMEAEFDDNEINWEPVEEGDQEIVPESAEEDEDE